LQDQLYTRDLPLLGGVMGRPAEVALLKGRNNYLCWHRLDAALAGGDGRTASLGDWGDSRIGNGDEAGRNPASRASTLVALQALETWGRSSRTGDLTELDDLSEDHALRGWITSTVDNCLGGRCEFYDRCFVLEARRKAQAAQVVVVNHHLLLADLALKESGFGELLPG